MLMSARSWFDRLTTSGRDRLTTSGSSGFGRLTMSGLDSLNTSGFDELVISGFHEVAMSELGACGISGLASRRASASRPRRAMTRQHSRTQGLLDGLAEAGEAPVQVAVDVDAESAPSSLGQHLEVASGLRRLDHTERVALAGHR